MEKMEPMEKDKRINEYNAAGKNCLPGYLGIEVISIEPDELHVKMRVQQHLLAPNGFLHAASIVALADSACGYGVMNNLPEGASGFTTIELKTNFLGTLLEGDLDCIARPVHKGRTTQVWDATVFAHETKKKIALFRCTQMILRKTTL